MKNEKSNLSGVWIVLGIVGVILLPHVALVLASIAAMVGIGWGLFRVVASPTTSVFKNAIQNVHELSLEGRRQAENELERKRIAFDVFMQNLADTHREMTFQELSNVRLSLELLLIQHPEIHEQISPESLRQLFEQHITAAAPLQMVAQRASLIDESIRGIANPPAGVSISSAERIETLLDEHRERLDALQMLPDDPDYNTEAMIEDERNRFLDEVNRVFTNQ